MRNRWLALFLALVVFLCPLSVFADGMPVTFGISVYDATTGEYLVTNRMMTGTLPLFYKDTLSVLEEQEILHVEYDENEWPVLAETDAAKAEATAEAVFYLKVNGDILELDQADRSVQDGCIIEWIYSDELHVASERSAFTRTNRIWEDEHRAALREAGSWMARQNDPCVAHYAALSIAGQPLSSTVVVSLPETARQSLKKDVVMTYAEQLFLLSACGYSDDQEVAALCLERIATQKMDTSNVMLASAALRAYDSRSYTLPEDAYNTRDLLVRRIVSAQNNDGGFARTRGFSSDFEATIDALVVLSQYDGEETTAAIRGGLSYLARWLKENGIKKSSTLSSGQVVSQMLTALICVNADITEERFTVDGATLADILLSMQNADGGFSAEFGESSDPETTHDAVVALAALKKGGSPYIFDAVAVENEGIAQYRMLGGEADGPAAYSGENPLEEIPGWAIALVAGGAVLMLGGIVLLLVFTRKRKA